MASEQVAAHSAKFPARPGELFAMYHIFQALGEFAGGRVRRVESMEAESVVGLAMSQAGRQCLLVANLTDRPQAVALRGWGGQAEVRRLTVAGVGSVGKGQVEAWGERSTGAPTLESPLLLPAHGIARIDRLGE